MRPISDPLRRALVLTAATTMLLVSGASFAALDDQLVAGVANVRSVQLGEQRLLVREQGALKEFADAKGKVFAARWRGFPDLRRILGSHFDAYQAAMQARPRGSLHFAHIVTPELDAAHMVYGGWAQGEVVLVKRLPKGVSLDALR